MTMMPNPSVNRTACKLRLQVPFAPRAPAACYLKTLGVTRVLAFGRVLL